jgi:hypothetical protein
MNQLRIVLSLGLILSVHLHTDPHLGKAVE